MSSLFSQWLIKIRSLEFAILVTIFVALTFLVSLGLTSDLDKSINMSIENIQGNKYLDIFMVIVTSLGDLSTLLIIGIILTIIRRTRRQGLIFLISMVFIAILIIYIKPLVGRLEPVSNFRSSLILPKNFVLENDSVVPFASSFSYPSNHMAITTAFAFIVGYAVYLRNRLAGMLIWIFPALIAVTKLYLMQQYFTDIVGGLLFGLIISIIMSDVLRIDEPFLMSRFKGKEDKNVYK